MTNNDSRLLVKLEPISYVGRDITRTNGRIFRMVKKFSQTFTEFDKSFVIMLESVRTGIRINANLENDKDYKVTITKQ